MLFGFLQVIPNFTVATSRI